MRPKALTITVSGEAATGKSAVAQYIRRALELYGARATVEDDTPARPALFLDQLLTAIGQSLVVQVRVVHERKEPCAVPDGFVLVSKVEHDRLLNLIAGPL